MFVSSLLFWPSILNEVSESQTIQGLKVTAYLVLNTNESDAETL